MDSTLLQRYELLAFLYGGFLLGIAIELNAHLRNLFLNRFYCHALDFLLILFVGVIAGGSFYAVNGGEFRLFGLLVMASGISLVRGSIGKLLPRWKPIRLYRNGKPMV